VVVVEEEEEEEEEKEEEDQGLMRGCMHEEECREGEEEEELACRDIAGKTMQGKVRERRMRTKMTTAIDVHTMSKERCG
jgi:hypothetical protein